MDTLPKGDDDDDDDDDDDYKPEIITVTGTISKSLRHYLSNILGKYLIKEQKIAILVTAHILQEVLM